MTIKGWNGVATWKWVANDDTCGICRVAFDGCCPDCKLPGDDCPLVWGQGGPLMKVKTMMIAAVKTSNLNLDHNKCKAKDTSHEKDNDEKVQQEDIKIFLGNLSSWQIHCQEALQICVDYNVDVAVITETRIRDNFKSAHYEAAAAGYTGLF